MKDPSSDELDDYFDQILTPNASKLKREEDGKAGLSFLFYYLGHGVAHEGITYMVLNEEEKLNYNPYSIECKLRIFTKTNNSFAFGALNCCREK